MRQYKRYEMRITYPSPNATNQPVQQYVEYMKQHPYLFNPILYGSLLTQQWCIDSYLRVEGNQLNYNRYNQKKLRAEEYKTLKDWVAQKNKGGSDIKVGNHVVLPSTFEGSPRNMYQKYLDAMTMVLRIGKPDLFITFTSNPRWP